MRTTVPAFLLALLAGASAQAAQVTVTVSNAVAGRGEIRASIFDGAAAFDKGDDPVAAVRLRVHGEGGTFAFDLPEGRYVVRVFQDIDRDGKLGTNMLGIPSEPFGFSNDAMGTMGPPSFDQAVVAVGAEPTAIRINLRR
ncbi:MAG TPA: DUF2141 domain-containing protein [Azospirillaceae bacterium]|nr:DUF2141 domain-containing protein [Azospirillaceae bacterium]